MVFVPYVYNSGTSGLFGNCSVWVYVSVCDHLWQNMMQVSSDDILSLLVASDAGVLGWGKKANFVYPIW